MIWRVKCLCYSLLKYGNKYFINSWLHILSFLLVRPDISVIHLMNLKWLILIWISSFENNNYELNYVSCRYRYRVFFFVAWINACISTTQNCKLKSSLQNNIGCNYGAIKRFLIAIWPEHHEINISFLRRWLHISKSILHRWNMKY